MPPCNNAHARRAMMFVAVLGTFSALVVVGGFVLAFPLGNRRDARLLQRGRVARVERDARQITVRRASTGSRGAIGLELWLRSSIGAAALVAVLVTVLVATHWTTVRDHVEAWHLGTCSGLSRWEREAPASPPSQGLLREFGCASTLELVHEALDSLLPRLAFWSRGR